MMIYGDYNNMNDAVYKKYSYKYDKESELSNKYKERRVTQFI